MRRADQLSEPLIDPVTLRCAHMLSRANAEKLARHAKDHGKELRCPTCRAIFDMTRVSRPVPFVVESLDALQVRCFASPACGWVGGRGELVRHYTRQCLEAFTRCSCGYAGRRGTAHPAWCPRVLVECPGPRCGVKRPRAELDLHLRACASARNVRASCASRLCSFTGSYDEVCAHHRVCGFLGERPMPVFERPTPSARLTRSTRRNSSAA